MKFSGVSQEALKAFIDRRHPEYNEYEEHWEFLEDTYEGGREWFEENLFKYHKEGDDEFAKRQQRAYRFNHTREVVDLVQKYIFKGSIERLENAPTELKDFWKSTTLANLDIGQFIYSCSTEATKMGSVWIFTDTNVRPGDVVSVADAKAQKSRVYAYMVSVLDVLDVGFDDQGAYTWVLVREWKRDDADPINSTGEVKAYYRLWMRDSWALFTVEKDATGDTLVKQIDEGVNTLGEIPGFRLDHIITGDRYASPGLIDDIAYLDRAIANYLSNIDAIIQDQTFSQLTIPAQSIEPGSDDEKKIIEMGTKRLFTYDAEGGGKPEYISPDPKQAGVILEVINKIINEIYHTVGMAGERTKSDNAVGTDNSSGVAKAYDFERVNSLLVSKASSLESAENRLAKLVMRWNSKSLEEDPVKYPETFDVRSLFDEFTIAENLALIDAPGAIRQEQMKQVVDKLFPRIAADLRQRIESEIKRWPTTVEAIGTPPSKIGSQVGKAPAQKRQGQVTKATA